mmetsp:Transcript_45467/g.132341  ORF Transcript_45467/g.132341 Transcript_45467/m.132341 type:complete len:283 (-) Transcript_45467:221-1069(-)
MFPVCERAMPSKEVMAAPRSRVRARKTARFSSATSARSNWSTMASLSLMDCCVSSCAVSSRPKASRSPNGISAVLISGVAGAAGAAGAAAGSSLLSGSSPSSCLSIRKKCKGPLASFDEESAAWDRTAATQSLRASKRTSSMVLSAFEGAAPRTWTPSCGQPVASATACAKRSLKSAGRGPFTCKWPCTTETFCASRSLALSNRSTAESFSMIFAGDTSFAGAGVAFFAVALVRAVTLTCLTACGTLGVLGGFTGAAATSLCGAAATSLGDAMASSLSCSWR